jgi:glycosyltransferase involved in cell wall biosynthesis
LLTVTESRDSGRLRVAHYPYYKMYGHLDIYSEILDSLQKTGKCDIVRILDVSHKETLRLISTCDIVLGKIIPNIGWFGRFELEGMALGKPVIAYISDELYDKYKPPVFITTNQNFRQDLEALLEDTSVQHKLAKEGIQYVKEYHSTKKIVETLQNIYRQLGS